MNLVEFQFSREELDGKPFMLGKDIGILDVYGKDDHGRLAVCARISRHPYSGISDSEIFEFDAIAASRLKFDSEKALYWLGE